MNAIQDINHVGMAVHDMANAVGVLETLGFLLTPLSAQRGAVKPGDPVVALGSANRCAIFATNYLEVLTHADPARPDPRQARFLGRHEGAHIISFGTEDTQAVYAEFTANDIRSSGVIALERDVDTADGLRTARFERVQFDGAATPEGLIQVARHLTPQYIHQTRYMGHPNRVTGLVETWIVAEDPLAVATRYARSTGRIAQPAHEGYRLDFARNSALRVLDATGAVARSLGTLPSAPPLIAAVVFASEDLPAMAIRLRAGQIEHVRVDDQLLVPNQAACGVAMLFRAA